MLVKLLLLVKLLWLVELLWLQNCCCRLLHPDLLLLLQLLLRSGKRVGLLAPLGGGVALVQHFPVHVHEALRLLGQSFRSGPALLLAMENLVKNASVTQDYSSNQDLQT